VEALRAAGHPVDRTNTLIDLIFGAGMKTGWHSDSTSVKLGQSSITLNNIARRGTGNEELFFVPAHRSMLISDGWAAPFQKLNSDTPVVARLFSQNLFDRFSGKDAGTLFPVERRLKKAIREKIDDAVFHGGKVGIEEDSQHALRLRLVHGDMHLPFMTWTAGQREFTPLLMGLYHLLPRTNQRKREETNWVVIEEPEMGLHPKAISAVMLLVLDLIWRGYRVVLSTHSPNVAALLWLMNNLRKSKASWKDVCEAFAVDPAPMHKVAEAALKKDYRAFALQFGPDGRVKSSDISALDPGSDDEDIAGWGGLTSYASRFAETVRLAANRSGI
jgi:AAA ATPase domain